MTSVFIVFAPVMPSLKLPVIFEFISRTSRLTRTRRLWNTENSSTMIGIIVSTISASFAFMTSMTIIAPTR